MHYFDNSLDVSILKEHLTTMVLEIKRENEFLSFNEIIKILRLDNYPLQKISLTFLKLLIVEEVKGYD